MFLKLHILTVHTLCYICINGIFLTSFLIMNCLLSFIWRLIDHKFLSNIFIHQESPFRSKSFPSLVFILLVPVTSFGSTEQSHCSLICSIIRLILRSFRNSLKQPLNLFPCKYTLVKTASAQCIPQIILWGYQCPQVTKRYTLNSENISIFILPLTGWY